jgi:hypothetical protein
MTDGATGIDITLYRGFQVSQGTQGLVAHVFTTNQFYWGCAIDLIGNSNSSLIPHSIDSRSGSQGYTDSCFFPNLLDN